MIMIQRRRPSPTPNTMAKKLPLLPDDQCPATHSSIDQAVILSAHPSSTA
jgi:hypothetical protein